MEDEGGMGRVNFGHAEECSSEFGSSLMQEGEEGIPEQGQRPVPVLTDPMDKDGVNAMDLLHVAPKVRSIMCCVHA